MKSLLPLFITLSATFGASAFAQSGDVPNRLGVQLRLEDAAGVPLSGPTALELRVYDAETGGNLLWAELQVATAQDGVVSAKLGATNPLPADLFDGGERFLALKVSGDPEMTPRLPLASAPYARRAQTVAELDASTVLPAGIVTGASIASGAITSTKLAPSSVTSVNLASNVIDTTKIVNGTVTDADVSAFAAIQGTKIAPNFGALDVRTTGRLGVGTTGLGDTLHVGGTGVRVEGSGGVNIRNPNNTAAIARFDWQSDVARLRMGGAGAGSANGFDFQRIGDISVMRLMGNGNVGIDSPNPAARLHVDGGTQISSTGIGYVQIGPSSGVRLNLDPDDIQARAGSSWGDLSINRMGGDVLLGNGSGDGRVKLPPNSIGPTELLSEPGGAQDYVDQITVNNVASSLSPVLVAKATIDCPASGFVLAMVSAEATSNDVFGGTYEYSLGINSVGSIGNQLTQVHGFDKREIVSMQRLMPVTAGSRSVYFHVGAPLGVTNSLEMAHVRVTAVYLPTAYGVVEEL